jgi:hypothetical protein
VPLAHFDGPPKPVFQRCREVIDRRARPEEHDNLLAVSQVFAGLRYDNPRLFEILGGTEAMLESPVLQRFLAEQMAKQMAPRIAEIVAERMHRAILGILEDRFGPVLPEVITALSAVKDDDRLQALIRLAARCPDLAAFRQELAA